MKNWCSQCGKKLVDNAKKTDACGPTHAVLANEYLYWVLCEKVPPARPEKPHQRFG